MLYRGEPQGTRYCIICTQWPELLADITVTQLSQQPRYLGSLSNAGVFAFYVKVYIVEPTFLCRLSSCIWSTTKPVSYLEVGLNQEEIGIDPDNTIFLEIAWGYLVWIVQ